MSMSFTQNVTPCPFPIALRPENVSEFERLLYLRPRYDEHALDEYTVNFDSDDKVLLTASGLRYDRKGVREFRDASGLPLFECEKIWTPAWRKRGPWLVRLPGNTSSSSKDEGEEIASTSRSAVSIVNKFDITFRNAAAQDAKTEEDRMITLHVRRTNPNFCVWSVSLGDKVLVHIRDSHERNKHRPSTGRLTGSHTGSMAYDMYKRLTVDVLVAENFDLSLVSV